MGVFYFIIRGCTFFKELTVEFDGGVDSSDEELSDVSTEWNHFTHEAHFVFTPDPATDTY